MSAADPTWTEIYLACRLQIKGQLDAGGVSDYSINGKRISRYSLDDLMKLTTMAKQLSEGESQGGGINYAKFGKAS